MMLLGTFLVWAGFAAILTSVAFYAFALRRSAVAGDGGSVGKFAAAGRIGFIIAASAVLATSVLLQYLIQTHHFEFNYVYKYSARGLSPGYLFATFWAGQEGSFLLWAFWTSILGLVLLCKLDPLMQRRVMPFYGGVLAFLLLLLAVKSPFIPYGAVSPMDPASQFVGSAWDKFWAEIGFIFSAPFMGAHAFSATIPADGNGLNPLLENPWMVIHPPTLFLGFASTAVTFAFAVSALAFGNDESWYRRAWPWALFCFAVLGFGVMLGGYWAYDTLGWGGFWGWDPVENGPLVPWLLMVGFLHAVQVQRVRGGLKTTTFLLGLLPFSATLYETFLTRTGILDKFSNHSFSTLGGMANSIILWGMLLIVSSSIGLLIWRARSIKNDSADWMNCTSRDFGFLIAILLLAASALFTGLGMSAPLITTAGVNLHIVAKQASIPAGYYNEVNFPIAILLAIGMGVGPYLAWKNSSALHVKPTEIPYALAVAATAVYWVVGWLILGLQIRPPMLLLFASAMFCLLSTGRMLLRVRKSGSPSPPRTMGGMLAHLGAACFLIGIALMVAYTRKSEATLFAGHSATLGSLPYTMTYEGMSSKLGMHDRDNLIKFRVEERPETDLGGIVERLPGHNALATSIRTSLMQRIHDLAQHRPAVTEIGMPLAIRKQESQTVILARPVIQPHWWGDLYFALISGPDTYYSLQPVQVKIAKGQTKVIGGYAYTFEGFRVPPEVGAQLQQGIMPDLVDVGGVMTITDPAGHVTHVTTHNIVNRLDPTADPSPEVPLPRPTHGPWWGVSMQSMNADKGEATFAIRDVTAPKVTGYKLEVSTRPFISFVWLGTILIAIGGLLSSRRRALENRLIPVDAPVTEVKPSGRERGRAYGRAPRRRSGKPAPAAATSVAMSADALPGRGGSKLRKGQ